MKKWIGLLIAALVAAGAFYFFRTYNRFVDMEEDVRNSWSHVETQYQRRSDLIPSLVATVKGYADHERETLEGVISARAAATSVELSADRLTPEAMAEFSRAQEGVRSALGRLLVSIERYPDLKADRNFQELQAQLEGTENRIAVARTNFNEVVRLYNASVRRFPSLLVASLCGFEQKPYFEASQKAQEAPVVEF